MKKIMFLLAFVSFGIFANASNGKVEKINSPVKKALVVKVNKKQVKAEWAYSFSCGGKSYAGCCWSTSADAYAAGVAAYNALCN